MTAYDAGELHRLRATAPATIFVQYEDEDGAPADPGVVTVTVADADGTALYTNTGTEGTGTARRTFALTSEDTAKLGKLAITWKSADLGDIAATALIVGGDLFAVRELRSFGKHQVADADDYPAEALLDAHDQVSEEFCEILRVAPYPMRFVEVLDGQPTDDYLIPDYRPWQPRARELVLKQTRCLALQKVEIRTPGTQDWVAFTEAQLADTVLASDGRLMRDTALGWPPGQQNVRVTYVAGWDQTPRAVRWAAMVVALQILIPSDLSDRTTSEVVNGATYRLATASDRSGHWYGLPQVDAVLARYRRPRPGIG